MRVLILSLIPVLYTGTIHGTRQAKTTVQTSANQISSFPRTEEGVSTAAEGATEDVWRDEESLPDGKDVVNQQMRMAGKRTIPIEPIHDEFRAKQALGRVITAPNGQFFVYEWMRPFKWAPEIEWLPKKRAGLRMQAWLYKVDTKYTPANSQYLFHPHPGSSYWLGALSPDSRKISFYVLNHDDDVIKAGVWNLADEELTWFDPAPDASRLDEAPVWLSSDELTYPGQLKSGALVKANAATGEAKACDDCEPLFAAAKTAAKKDAKGLRKVNRAAPEDVPPNAKLLARSDTGDLAVYAEDTAAVLTVLYTKGENPPEILFQNGRRPTSAAQMKPSPSRRDSIPTQERSRARVSSASAEIDVSNPPLRPWAVEDSVAVRYLVTDQEIAQEWQPGRGAPIVPSPDGQRFFFITRRGVLPDDCVLYELHVFVVRDVTRALSATTSHGEPIQPHRVLRLCSGSNHPAIGKARWVDGGTAIAFVGAKNTNKRRVYRFNVISGVLSPLTPASHDVEWFELEEQSIVYDVYELAGRVDQYPMMVLQDYDFGYWLGGLKYSVARFASYRGGDPAVLRFSMLGRRAGPWISPDGRKAIAVVPVDGLSMSGRSTEIPAPVGPSRSSELASFVLIDLEHARATRLANALWGEGAGNSSIAQPKVLWSRDSTSAILVNVDLPATPSRRSPTCACIAAYEVEAGKWQMLEPVLPPPRASDGKRVDLVASDVTWLLQGTELLVRHLTHDGEPSTSTLYRRIGRSWVAHSAPAEVASRQQSKAALADSLIVTVRQSANDAPVVVASRGTAELPLTTPDPALRHMWRARTEPVQWREADGRSVTGSLMLPRNAAKSEPLPLVIQAFYHLPDRFLPDGVFPTGYAAQALAANGIAVLHMDIPMVDRQDLVLTPREGPAFVKRIDAAVEVLAAGGRIDPERIGLIGFSRAGYMAYYALTHPGQTRLAAAVNADGWTGSYWLYLYWTLISPGTARLKTEFERLYGGGTFWQNNAGWLEHETTFNVDKVETPFLFATIGQISPATMDVVAAFRLNKRPLEYIVFPEGEHQLIRPRERLAFMEASVDWMSFWLTGREDANPTKAAQYIRWKKLRQQHEALPVNRAISPSTH